jgi:hypothetical protein
LRNLLTSLCSALLLTACATPPGSYRVTAITQDGKPITGNITADVRGLSAARSSTCLENPGATVKIVDANTGQELAGESPYKCP